MQDSLTQASLHFQSLMTTLPSQDAPLPPPQQPYISGQQPMYQQVSVSRLRMLSMVAVLGRTDSVGQDGFPADSEDETPCTHARSNRHRRPDHACAQLNPTHWSGALGSLLGQDGNREPTTGWEEGGLGGTEPWG